jgi:hypothetical protein
MAGEDEGYRIVSSQVMCLAESGWTERSRATEDLTPRFSFLLWEKVYTGALKDIEAHAQDPAFHHPLRIPDLGARLPLRPTAAEVRGREAALAAYYRERMAHDRQKPRAGDVGYWIWFGVGSESTGFRFDIPHWDRLRDSAKFLKWLRTAGYGGEFEDQEQGWMMEARRAGERLHFRFGDPDTAEEQANLSVDRDAFLRRLDEAEAQAKAVVAALTAELGMDLWS